jgi:hypothetical protein
VRRFGVTANTFLPFFIFLLVGAMEILVVLILR